MKFKSSWQCCWGLLPLILGCTGIPPVGGENPGDVAPEIRAMPLEDVPEPRGYARYESEKNSYTFVEGRYRRAELHYRGSSPSESVAKFYEAQMPIHGWQKSDRQEGKGSRLLTFEKIVGGVHYVTRVSAVEKRGWTDLEIRLDTVDEKAMAAPDEGQ
ncbi:MAG: hypothetical protein RL885_29380 [Planctomycetota bacterium]